MHVADDGIYTPYITDDQLITHDVQARKCYCYYNDVGNITEMIIDYDQNQWLDN